MKQLLTTCAIYGVYVTQVYSGKCVPEHKSIESAAHCESITEPILCHKSTKHKCEWNAPKEYQDALARVGNGNNAIGGGTIKQQLIQAKADAQVTGVDWMSFLPDTIPLNQISMPSTHDTVATEGGGLYKTQVLSVTDQLYMGVRMLDIRVRWLKKEERFVIAHGTHVFAVDLRNVLDQVTAFLDHANTETVIILMWAEKLVPIKGLKKTKPTKQAILKFFEKFNDESKANDVDVQKYKKYIAPVYHPHGKLDVPKLGRVRGKIVLMSMFVDSTPLRLTKMAMSADLNTLYAEPDHNIWAQSKNDVEEYKELWNDIIDQHVKVARAGEQGITFYGISSGVTSGLNMNPQYGPYWWAPQINPVVAARVADGAMETYNSAIASRSNAQSYFVGSLSQDFLDKTSPIPQLIVFTNVDIWRNIIKNNKGYSEELYKSFESTYKKLAITGWSSRNVVTGKTVKIDQKEQIREMLLDGIAGYVQRLNLAHKFVVDVDKNGKVTQKKEKIKTPKSKERETILNFIKDWAVEYFREGGDGDNWAPVGLLMATLAKKEKKTAQWVLSIPMASQITKNKLGVFDLVFPKNPNKKQKGYAQLDDYDAAEAYKDYLSHDNNGIYNNDIYADKKAQSQSIIGYRYIDIDSVYNEYILVIEIIILIILSVLLCCAFGACLIFIYSKCFSFVNKINDVNKAEYVYNNIQNNENEV